MELKLQLSIVVLCLISLSAATDVQKCKGTSLRKIESSDISITNCVKGICKLKKKHEYTVRFNFVPEHTVDDLTTLVSAEVYGIPLPFIGVDSTSAKEFIFDGDTDKKAEWPLQAGITYTYQRSFKVLEIYPKVSVLVRWSLANNNNDMVCFQVPAVIV